jgi:hypothetical protein
MVRSPAQVRWLFRVAPPALAAWLALAPPAAATLYVCTTPDGRTITADRVPVECGNRDVRELRPDGSTRRVIERPLTEQERAARAEQERREAREKDRRLAQSRRDLALLSTYSSEEEILKARDETLAKRQIIFDRAQERIETLKKERKKLDDEKEFYVNRKVPDKLVRGFASNAEMMAAQDKLMQETVAENERIKERFAAEVKRFRELVAAGARPMARASAN